MSSYVVTSPKNTAELRVVEFDFSSMLALAETIASAVVTATVFSGVDASPADILSGVDSVVGSVVKQSITGGTAGVIYNLSCNATTSTGQELIINTLLAVVSTNPF